MDRRVAEDRRSTQRGKLRHHLAIGRCAMLRLTPYVNFTIFFAAIRTPDFHFPGSLSGFGFLLYVIVSPRADRTPKLRPRPQRGEDLPKNISKVKRKLGRKRKNERPLQSPVLINTKSWLPHWT